MYCIPYVKWTFCGKYVCTNSSRQEGTLKMSFLEMRFTCHPKEGPHLNHLLHRYIIHVDDQRLSQLFLEVDLFHNVSFYNCLN